MEEAQLIPYASTRFLGKGTILVFAPHPDDEVFGCGGAIIRHIEAGDRIHVVILTDGDYQCPDYQGISVNTEAYIQQRRTESRQAAAILGYGTPIFWRLKDRGLQYSEWLVCRIASFIREVGADLVYAPSPKETHPDHRATAMATIEAIRRVGGNIQLAAYEVGVPLHPNKLLDITDIRDKKHEAMKCFKSQIKRQDYIRHIEALNQFRTYTLSAEFIAAEAYCMYSAVELQKGISEISVLDFLDLFYWTQNLNKKGYPLVSVIVRSIGRSQLSEALNSVAFQTYTNIEVIVVNALGSAHTNLPNWCGRFPSKMVGDNRSLSRSIAANMGLHAANGEYIAFLDDDDLWLPDHISSLVEILQSNQNYRAAYTNVKCLKQHNGEWEQVCIFNNPFNKARLLLENYIPIHAVLFSKNLLYEGCHFDESLDLFEDWDFWLQLSRRTEFFHKNHLSAIYRITASEGSGINSLVKDKDIKLTLLKLFNKWRYQWTSEETFSLLDYAKAASLVPCLRRDLASLQNQLAEQHEKLARTEQDCAYKQELVKMLENKLAEIQQDDAQNLALLHQSKEAQMRELEIIRNSIDEIHRSTSWRITYPLRKIRMLFNSLF